MEMAVPRKVVLFGVSGSGKSTLGEGLRTHFGHYVVAFADPLKHAAKAIFNFRDEDLWGPSHTRETPYPEFEFSGWCFECSGQCVGPERYLSLLKLDDEEAVELSRIQHAEDKDYWRCGCCNATYPRYVTPREALKTLGTAWGRRFCRDVWAASCFYRMNHNLFHVVTDGRFWNELNQAKKHHACTVLLKRGLAQSTSPHPSEAEVREMALEPGAFDIVLDNREGTPEQNLRRLFEAFDQCYKGAAASGHKGPGNVEWTKQPAP
jgi:hypothetical protein